MKIRKTFLTMELLILKTIKKRKSSSCSSLNISLPTIRKKRRR